MTSGIIEILREDTGVQVLAGLDQAGTKYKIYPVVAPEDTPQPYITVYKVQNDPVSSLSKDLPSELDYPRVTVNCWAKNFRMAELMGEAVRNALDNKAAQTDAGYTFTRIWLVDDRDAYDASQPKLNLHSLTFGIELKRVEGEFYDILSSSGFAKWGGLWPWASHSNNYPTGNAGTIWITEGDITLSSGSENFLIPSGSWMISKINGANEYEEFTFNL